MQEEVRKIKLINDAGVMTMLKAYVKRAENLDPYKCGRTDNFAVGKSRTLDLNQYNPDLAVADGMVGKKEDDPDIICEGDLVTAYAAVSCASDEAGEIWFTYSSKSKKTAVFNLSGPLGKLTLGFAGLETEE